MKYRIVLLLIFMLPLFCFGQLSEKRADSLLNLLNSHTAKDTVRVKLLLEYLRSSYLVRPDSAVLFKYADEALQLSDELGWSTGIVKAYQMKGAIHTMVTGDLVNAVASYQQAVKANEKAGIRNLSWKVHSDIGLVYFNNKLFRKAADYNYRAIDMARKENVAEKELMSVYLNIANASMELKMPDSAIYFFEKCLALQDERTNPAYKIAALTSAGYAYSQTTDLQKSKVYLDSALAMSEANNYAMGVALTLNNLSQLSLKMKDYPLAESYAKQALTYLEPTPYRSYVATALKTLSDSYYNQGKHKEAYEAFSRSYLIIDSNLTLTNDEKLSFMEAEFEYDKKEAVLNAEHKAELKQQETVRNFLIGGAVLIVATSALLFFSYKRRRDAITKKNDAELKAQITDTEMKVMRLQMNPHFIFNSLNSISDYIAKNNPKEADDYLSKFAKVMRMTLENSEQQAIPLSDDLKALELYMQLEAKRLNNKFTFEIKVGDDIDKENTLVPPMIFQPFVENSIWHGIAKKEGQGHIVIDIKKDGEMLNCRIDDDGIGRKMAESMKAEQDGKKQSLGMRITKARIEILNKLKGSNATVQLIDKLQGVTAELKLPAETNF